VGDFALGARVPTSFLDSGVTARLARIAAGIVVFLGGLFAGAALAAWIMPPV
jgi:hypothetical protein